MNVPKLRFKEFSGEWVNQKLGDICLRVMDGTHFSPKSKEGNYKYLTSKNIRNTGIDLKEVSYISEQEHQEIFKRCPVKFGDVLLTKDGANTGNCCLNTLTEPFSLLSSVAVLDGKDSVLNNYFLLQFLQSDFGVNQINNVMAGQAITRITLDKIKKFNLSIPSFPEQTKIASFLTATDEKIAQLTQKHALLNQYKKGMMQQIFSQALRFKDESGEEFGDWEERNLGEVATFYNGRAYKQTEWEKQGTPVIRLQNLTGSGMEYYYSNLQLPAHQYCHKGDLLYMWSATFGPVFWCGEKAIYHYHIWKIITDNAVLSKNYLFFILDLITERMKNTSNGSTMLHITKGEIEKMKVFLPSLPEQIKIANFLSSIDQKIDQVAAQLDATKQYKRGLLQQMFV